MLNVNDKLYTKDGRKIGNAIVTKIRDHKDLGTLYLAITDYGNSCLLTLDEIETLFYTEQKELSPEWEEIVKHKHAV